MSAYPLTFGGLRLLGGRAADARGRRRMFMVETGLFATGLARPPARPSTPAHGPGCSQRTVCRLLCVALAGLNLSPVVELNRAVAVGLADGPAAGLAMLAPLLAEPALERYQLRCTRPTPSR